MGAQTGFLHGQAGHGMGALAVAVARADTARAAPSREAGLAAHRDPGAARLFRCPEAEVEEAQAPLSYFTSSRPNAYRATTLSVLQSRRSKLRCLSSPPTKKQFSASTKPFLVSNGTVENVGPTTTLGMPPGFQSRSLSRSSFCAFFIFAWHSAKRLSEAGDGFGVGAGAAGGLDASSLRGGCVDAHMPYTTARPRLPSRKTAQPIVTGLVCAMSPFPSLLRGASLPRLSSFVASEVLS